MKLSEIQSTLAELGSKPTRSLGQNFLHDQNLAEWIVNQLAIRRGDAWVEVGPGLGALTRVAVARSSHGLIIEKDGRLVRFLHEHYPQLETIHGDAVDFDVRDLFPRGPVKVFGNLPYYVSSQILFRFTSEPSPVAELVFTLQRELAERLAASPRTKEFGALTVLIGQRWRAKLLRTLPPTVFMPAPKVDSAVVHLSPRRPGELPACDTHRFAALVKQGFSQRRKQLRKLLSAYLFDWSDVCHNLAVPETVRAEELSIMQWIALTNLAPARRGVGQADQAQDVHGEVFDVVDERDTIIRQASRHDVHAGDLRHRAVHIFVFNKAGDLFLQKRSSWKDRHPGLWDSSAAGHVNAGQGYEETAHRELLEELGISSKPEEIAALTARPETGWEFIRLYRTVHDGPFFLAPAEIDTGGFFSRRQVARWIDSRPEDFAPGFLECWKELLAESASP